MEGGELPPPVVAEEAVQGLKYRPGAARQLRARLSASDLAVLVLAGLAIAAAGALGPAS